MTGSFLLAVIAVALAIIIAAPQYAEPPLATDTQTTESVALPLEPEVEGDDVHVFVEVIPESKPPSKLHGYVWPVRGGGMVATYYEPDARGDFQIDGVRVHDGLVITWFDGAKVKAAHRGTVVAAGREWARHTGFDGSLDKVYERYASGKNKKSKKPVFPQGVVIDDGNGYYSVYSELKDLQVKVGDKVKAGQLIGHMSKAESKQMMRYRLVRMDGEWMRVHQAARDKDYPDYARERVDPLAVLKTEARKAPQLRGEPKDPPRLSEY